MSFELCVFGMVVIAFGLFHRSEVMKVLYASQAARQGNATARQVLDAS